jgi:hypothetical protein
VSSKCQQGLRLSQILRERFPPGDQGRDGVGTLYHPLGHLLQRLVFGIEGFECCTPLVGPPLVETAGHRPLQAVDLSSQSGVPGDLPLSPQPVLQANLILNASGYRRPWVDKRATFVTSFRQSIQGVAGKVLNARVDCYPVV